MSLQRQIEISRAHLADLKERVDSYGGPCTRCKFGSHSSDLFMHYCRHPLVRQGRMDEVTGKVSWHYRRQSDMRQSDLCGHVGRLFERANPAIIAMRAVPVPVYYILSILTIVFGPAACVAMGQ